MSVQNQITRIQTAVADAYSAVDEMGGTLPQSETVANLKDAILTIPQGSSAVTVTEEQDEHGGIIKRINAVSLQGDTVTADTMLAGTTAHDKRGNLVTGTLNSNNVPWQRPAEWPDYSKLHLLENETEAIFFTYDNRMPPTKVGIVADVGGTTVNHNYYVDRVIINDDGSITELERTTLRSWNQQYKVTLHEDAGDYVCLRVTPQEGLHITTIGMYTVDGGGNESHRTQPLLERYGYLPYCSNFGYQYGYNGWGNYHLVSDTILGMSDNIQRFGATSGSAYAYNYNLENIQMDNWTHVPVNGPHFFRGVIAHNLDITKIYMNAVDAQYMFCNCSNIRELDASSLDFSSVTNVNAMFQSMSNLKKVKLPTGFGTALTGAIGCFRYDYKLEGVDFPDTFTTGFAASCFGDCYNLRYIVIRSATVVSLANTNAFDPAIGINLANYYLRFYVPAALIDQYKEATNWATLYANAGVEIFLPIEGSQFDTTT